MHVRQTPSRPAQAVKFTNEQKIAREIGTWSGLASAPDRLRHSCVQSVDNTIQHYNAN